MLVEEQTSYKNLHAKIHYIQRRRWGFCITGNFEMWIYTYMIFIYIYVDIPFKKYNLCQVSSTSFVQSVRSSKLLLCCWVVKLSHRFTFASSWFLSRHSSYHVILPLLGELTDLCLPRALRVTVLDISRHKWRRKSQQHAHMLMWCHGDVLKFSTPKNLQWGHFFISPECSNSCVDTMNGWLQTKVAWVTRCSPSQPQRCLLQWLGRERWVAVLHQAIGNIQIFDSSTACFSDSVRWLFVEVRYELWRWYEDGMIFVSPMVPCCKFQCHAMAPMAPSFKAWGPGSLQVDESDVEQCHLFAAKVQAVHQEVPGGGADGVTVIAFHRLWWACRKLGETLIGFNDRPRSCAVVFLQTRAAMWQCECFHSSTWLLLIFTHAWWATYNFNIMSGVQRCLCLSILCDTYVTYVPLMLISPTTVATALCSLSSSPYLPYHQTYTAYVR